MLTEGVGCGTRRGGDGAQDLVLRFPAPAIRTALAARYGGPLHRGDRVELELTADLGDSATCPTPVLGIVEALVLR